MKICSVCREYKDEHEFRKDAFGYTDTCKKCHSSIEKRKFIEKDKKSRFIFDGVEYKTCKRCGKQKPTSEFFYHYRDTGTLYYYCKDCSKSYILGKSKNSKTEEEIITKKDAFKEMVIALLKEKKGSMSLYQLDSKCVFGESKLKSILQSLIQEGRIVEIYYQVYKLSDTVKIKECIDEISLSKDIESAESLLKEIGTTDIIIRAKDSTKFYNINDIVSSLIEHSKCLYKKIRVEAVASSLEYKK